MLWHVSHCPAAIAAAAVWNDSGIEGRFDSAASEIVLFNQIFFVVYVFFFFFAWLPTV